MYVPKHFHETDPETIAGVIRDYNFGTLITAGAQGLFATHLPFVPDPERPLERLQAHMAKANPHWRDLKEGAPALAIFQGPHAYVSASWYSTKLKVPTWNYVAVHVTGRARAVTDPAQIRAILAATVAQQESGRAQPWRMEDLPEDFISGMAKGVVGVAFEVERVEGKFKLSQNVTRADQEGAIRGLLAEGDAMAESVAAAMVRACGLQETTIEEGSR